MIGRLVRRLRVEFRFPMTQASVLGRLDREGPQCIGELATKERVRPQSMSQTLAELEADNLIERRPDANDGAVLDRADRRGPQGAGRRPCCA